MAHRTGASKQADLYDREDEALFSKVSWRLLPLLIVCYVISFLDRVNIGFAQLQMKETLHFSDAAFALGAGIFFIGYFLFEVPSNLWLEKIGARKTLLRIMFCWGLVASAMMFVKTIWLFYTLRFLLGAFEAGFFPGIILYLTYWYPGARRAKAIAIFMTGATIAYLIAGPISGWTLKYMDGLAGFRGWQWMFLTQGMPATLLGIFAYFYLKDGPEQADWLTDDEKARLRHHLEDDPHLVQTASHGSFWGLLRDPKVYVLSIAYFLILGAVYVLVFSMPSYIQSWGIQDFFIVGLLSMIPPAFALICMIFLGRSSDRYMERRWHLVLCCTLGVAGATLGLISWGHVGASIAGLALINGCQSAIVPIFFATVSEYLPEESAAGGIALISSLGNLGPAVMPYLVVRVAAGTGGAAGGMWVLIALWLAAALILLAVVRPRRSGPVQTIAA